MQSVRDHIEERGWAQGMTQEQFDREWPRRHPESDVIPDVEIWTANLPVRNDLIDGVNPGDALADDDTAARLPEELKPDVPRGTIEEPKVPEFKKKKGGAIKGSFPCRGCGKVFEYKLARAGHERACKVALNTKMGG